MSELKDTRDASTNKKLPPPKSLQGQADAEATWDIIVKRYPKAAPLLCEMETVIEKAEGLLQQLRSPFTQVLGRSSSFQIADSEDELMGPCQVEESTEVSMLSEQDSRSACLENMTPEVVSVAAYSVEISDHRESISASEQTFFIAAPSGILGVDASVGEQPWSPDPSYLSINDVNSSSFELETEDIIVHEESLKSSTLSMADAQKSPNNTDAREVEKCSSLEAWGKVVGETTTQGRKPVTPAEFDWGTGSLKEDSVSEHVRRLGTLKSGPMQQITKLNLLGKKEEMMQRFAGTIATASKVADTTRLMEETKVVREAEKVPDAHVQPATNDTELSEETKEGKINERGEQIAKSPEKQDKCMRKVEAKRELSFEVSKRDGVKTDDDVQGNGDKDVEPPRLEVRSPVEILNEYSKICEIAVEYENLNPSCSYNKNVIVKCSFGGFAFEACAGSKKMAKAESAAKLLRCVAGRQIDGDNMLGLKHFTRNQIMEIISLGTGGEQETSIRKLYRICIELNEPEPMYTVNKTSGLVGNRYTVKCEALGHTTSGFGIRTVLAKRIAADQLLQIYHSNRNSPH